MTSVLDLEDHASPVDGMAALVMRLRQEGEGLRSALRGTVAMQQAIGIVMERYALDASEAFERLLQVAAESRRTMPEVADDLVAARTGQHGLRSPGPTVSVTHGQSDDAARLQAAFQQCAVALPMALTEDHAVDVLVGTGLAPLGPCAVALYRLNDDGWLNLRASSPDDWLEEWQQIPNDERLPMSLAGHQGAAVWLTSPSAWDAISPEFSLSGAEFIACLPTHRNGRVEGALVIGWLHEPALTESAQRHGLAVADLGAEALHRLDGRTLVGGEGDTESAGSTAALVEAGLHPTALVRPIRDVGGAVIDFEIEWVITPDHDPAIEGLTGVRLLEAFPDLSGTSIDRILREAVSAGDQQRYENIVVQGDITRGRPIRFTVTATPFLEGLLVAWVNHAQEDQRLAQVTDELTVRREQSARDRQAIEVMQRSALPDEELTQVAGIDVVARYLPVLNDPLGGDWYDIFFHDGRVWLAVGDVAGHGVAAAAQMTQLRNAARGLIVSGADPAQVCETLNRLTLTFPAATMATTATCVIGVLDPAGPTWSWANAGHPAPIVLQENHAHRVLESPPGLLLGVSDSAVYHLAHHTLPVDATLLLMTDGMFEQPGEPVEIGIATLLKDLPGGDIRAMADQISRGLPLEHRDDACFLLARCQSDRTVS